MSKFVLSIILLLLFPNFVLLQVYYDDEYQCTEYCGVGYGGHCEYDSSYGRYECTCYHGFDGKNCTNCAPGYFGKSCAFPCPSGFL